MKISAGLLIIQENKILLVHPSNSPQFGTYSIPKGKVEKGETLMDAAIRETEEEVGLKIPLSDINKTPYCVEYKNKHGKVYKKVYYFIVYPKHKISLDQTKLAMREVDISTFADKREAMSLIFWRFEEMLNFIY